MSKFNRAVAVAVKSPVATAPAASGVTYEGAPGFARDAKSELFLLAVSHLGDASFYEKAADRNDRFTALVDQVAAEDPEWTGKFIPWLRDTAGMRTASVIAAAEALKALQSAGKPGGRQVVAGALRRADEPGELLAYWMSRYGRKLPVTLNRGVSDAVKRLYTEFGLLKYDSREAALRFGDVVELVNPRYHLKEYGTWRDALWRYAIEVRHGRGNEVPGSLPMIRANAALRKAAAEDASVLLDTERLKAAGMTWEDALSLAGPRAPKRELWTALVPLLGYFALIRNLRNIDEAGVPDSVAQAAMARISDPEQVRRSRLFPFRFLAAFQAVPSLRWAYPLEQALNASLSNVPQLTGRTLVLVDRSGSMFDRVSEKTGLNRADSAALFGSALAVRAQDADLVEFGTSSSLVLRTPAAKAFGHSESLLKMVQRFGNLGGTNTAGAVRSWYKNHDRVVVVTDEQAHGGYALAAVPGHVPVYTWNLAGYQHGHAPSGLGSRHTFGGLTDHAFRLIPMLEAGHGARWDDLFGTSA